MALEKPTGKIGAEPDGAESTPALRLLSLGAGVQSSALLILAARGDLPKLDAAIFSDTGWEPSAVYEHLDRLEREVAQPAGIPIYTECPPGTSGMMPWIRITVSLPCPCSSRTVTAVTG